MRGNGCFNECGRAASGGSIICRSQACHAIFHIKMLEGNKRLQRMGKLDQHGALIIHLALDARLRRN